MMVRAWFGEEFLLFGREPDIFADPVAEIPGIACWHSRRKPLEELAFVATTYSDDGAGLAITRGFSVSP